MQRSSLFLATPSCLPICLVPRPPFLRDFSLFFQFTITTAYKSIYILVSGHSSFHIKWMCIYGPRPQLYSQASPLLERGTQLKSNFSLQQQTTYPWSKHKYHPSPSADHKRAPGSHSCELKRGVGAWWWGEGLGTLPELYVILWNCDY